MGDSLVRKEAVVDDPEPQFAMDCWCAMDHANEPDADLEAAFNEKRKDISGFIRNKLFERSVCYE